jgi:uncharacterized membrane protein YphA (DoxX/SURF4 family)
VTSPPLRRWAEWWNRYWFTPAPTVNLAMARILAVATQLFWVFPSLDEQLSRLQANSRFIHPQLLIRIVAAIFPRDTWFTPGTITAIYWLTVAAGVLALVGLFTRPAMLALALGVWFLVAHRFSYGDVHHSEAMFAFFLMSLALAPSGDDLSVDAWRRRRAGRPPAEMSPFAHRPFALAHLLLAMVYFSTGITKLIFGGLQWMNGYTLQGRTLMDALGRDIPLGIWFAQQHTLAILLSIGTVIFELGFCLSLFLPRWKTLFFAAALAFHVGLHLVGGHGFFGHMAVVLILFLCYDPPWLRFPARSVAQ